MCQNSSTIGGQIYSAFKQDKGHSLMLIQECQSLEGKLASHGVTDTILNNQSTLKDVKKQLLKKDWECCVVQASQHASTAVAASVSWVKLWDMALDYGPHGTKSLKALYRTLTRPSFQCQTCHLCDSECVSYFNHFVLHHTPISDPELVINSLKNGSPDINFWFLVLFVPLVLSALNFEL